MTKYGYARVSTTQQDLSRQLATLHRHGVDDAHIETEKVSGTKRDRPALNRLLAELQKGDELHVAKLDRLGRSTRDLIDLAGKLEERGVALVVDGERHDPTTPMGRLFFHLLAMLAEFERDLTAERTAESLAVKRANGVRVGRAPSTTDAQRTLITRMHRDGYTITELADAARLSRSTISRIVKAGEDQQVAQADPSIMREARRQVAERQKALDRLSKTFL